MSRPEGKKQKQEPSDRPEARSPRFTGETESSKAKKKGFAETRDPGFKSTVKKPSAPTTPRVYTAEEKEELKRKSETYATAASLARSKAYMATKASKTPTNSLDTIPDDVFGVSSSSTEPSRPEVRDPYSDLGSRLETPGVARTLQKEVEIDFDPYTPKFQTNIQRKPRNDPAPEDLIGSDSFDLLELDTLNPKTDTRVIKAELKRFEEIGSASFALQQPETQTSPLRERPEEDEEIKRMTIEYEPVVLDSFEQARANIQGLTADVSSLYTFDPSLRGLEALEALPEDAIVTSEGVIFQPSTVIPPPLQMSSSSSRPEPPGLQPEFEPLEELDYIMEHADFTMPDVPQFERLSDIEFNPPPRKEPKAKRPESSRTKKFSEVSQMSDDPELKPEKAEVKSLLARWGLTGGYGVSTRPEVEGEEKRRYMSAELKDLINRDRRVMMFWSVGPNSPLVEIQGNAGNPKFYTNGEPTTLELFRAAIKGNRRSIYKNVSRQQNLGHKQTANRMLGDYQAAAAFVKIEETPIMTYDAIKMDLEQKVAQASLANDAVNVIEYNKQLHKLDKYKANISRLTKKEEAIALPYNDVNHKGYAYQDLISKKDLMAVLEANGINTVLTFDALFTPINEYMTKLTNMAIGMIKYDPTPEAAQNPIVQNLFAAVRRTCAPRDYAKVTKVDSLFVKTGVEHYTPLLDNDGISRAERPKIKVGGEERIIGYNGVGGVGVVAGTPLRGIAPNPNRVATSNEEGREQGILNFQDNPNDVDDLSAGTLPADYPGSRVEPL